MRSLFYCIAVISSIAGVTALHADDTSLTLFNGKDLTGFRFVLQNTDGIPAKEWFVRDGLIVVAGKQVGYLMTEKSYTEYTLSFQWKYVRPEGLESDEAFTGNSGLLLHIQPPYHVWPTAIEYQLLYGDAGNTFGIGSQFAGKLDKAKQKTAMKPVGEWNTSEVTVSLVPNGKGAKTSKIVSRLNGVEICTGEGNLTAGPIGWQSDGAELHLRNLQIR